MAVRQRVQICGLLSETPFHIAKCCAEDLFQGHPEVFEEPQINGMLEFDWNLYIEKTKKDLRGQMWQFNETAITFVDGQLIGDASEFVKYAQEKHGYEIFRPLTLYETLAEEAYKTHLNSTNHDYVFMDISIGEQPVGRLVFELFSDVVPKTCENFRVLCTGEKGESAHTEYRLHYEKSVFHRIVKNGWIQGGDIWMKKGDGGESIYGPAFEDENFAIRHSQRGILGMANKGRHSNGSQFYISLQPAKWMDTKYVAFGRVIEGTETLKAMEEQETMNDRPLKEIAITGCGVLTFEF